MSLMFLHKLAGSHSTGGERRLLATVLLSSCNTRPLRFGAVGGLGTIVNCLTLYLPFEFL